MFDSAYSIIWLSPFYEKIEKKFSLFLEFSREVEVEYEDSGYENTEIFDDITKDALSPIDYKFYEVLFEGGVITEKDFHSYIAKEKMERTKAKLDEDPDVIRRGERYTFYFKQKPTDNAVINAVAKTYFGVGDKEWHYIEPLFYAILENDLDMDEDNVYVYTMLLTEIEMDPEYAGKIIVDKLKVLDEFKDVENIKDVIGVSLEGEELSKALLDFLLEAIEKVRKGKGEEFNKSETILKAILKLA
jgi:hypothetical protein